MNDISHHLRQVMSDNVLTSVDTTLDSRYQEDDF